MILTVVVQPFSTVVSVGDGVLYNGLYFYNNTTR